MKNDSDKGLVIFLMIVGLGLAAIGWLSVLASSDFMSWLLLISGLVCFALGAWIALTKENIPGVLTVIFKKQKKIDENIVSASASLERANAEVQEVSAILAEFQSVPFDEVFTGEREAPPHHSQEKRKAPKETAAGEGRKESSTVEGPGGASSHDAPPLRVCPRCGGTHIAIQVTYKHEIKNAHHGAAWWLFVGWWWVPLKWIYLTVPALLVKIFNPRKRLFSEKITLCVCQSCGESWQIINDTSDGRKPIYTRWWFWLIIVILLSSLLVRHLGL